MSARPLPDVVAPLADHALVQVDALALLVEGAALYVKLEHDRLLERRSGGDLLAVIHACQRMLGCDPVSSVAESVAEADVIVALAQDGWVSVEEAVVRTGITGQGITKAIRADRLRARKVGNRWRIDPSSLEEVYP